MSYRAALIVAAVASIATSPPPQWDLEARVDVPFTTLFDRQTVGFGITTESRGPRDDQFGGEIDVAINLSGQTESMGPATVIVTLTSETDPTVREVREIEVHGTENVDVILPAWESCQVAPCFDDFRLEIENTAENSQINLLGSVFVRLHGEGKESDSAVFVEITPLGVLP